MRTSFVVLLVTICVTVPISKFSHKFDRTCIRRVLSFLEDSKEEIEKIRKNSSVDAESVRKNMSKKLSQQELNEINQITKNILELSFEPTHCLDELHKQYIEINTNLQRIQAIESELKVKSFDIKNRLTTIERFCKWSHSNGAQFDGVRIQEFPHYGLGLVATRDFKSGEFFAIIPKKMMFTFENLGETTLEVLNQIPKFHTMLHAKLALALVIERLNGNISFWQPYIDMLPERYSTAVNFTPNEISELKGTAAFVMSLNQCKHIARQYAFIHKTIQNLPCEQPDSIVAILKDGFTYDLYRWAVSTMMTRQNHIPLNETNKELTNDGNPAKPSIEEDAKVPVLIPFWDVANHANGMITSNYSPMDGQVEGATMTDVKKDEQIFMYYGNRNNANFLVHNGFIVEENQSDNVVIRLELNESDPLVKQRAELLDSIGITKYSQNLNILPAPKFVSPSLLAFGRIFNMNEDQVNYWLAPNRAASDLKYTDYAFDTELEIKTWNFLKMRLMILLKAFPTTLEEDIDLFKQHQQKGQQKLSQNKKMVIQYRITEKRILRDALAYVEERSKQ